VWQLGPGEFVSIQATTTDRRSQEEILSAIRTVELITRSPAKPKRQPNSFVTLVQFVGVFAIPLAGYLAVAFSGGYLLFRRKSRSSSIGRPRRRALLAAYFALVLTPSLLTDLFLFAIPAPALVGFFTLLPSLFYVERWPTGATQ
jgi:hypothetical protein